MNVKFNCPGCGRQLSAPESAAGRKSKCPGCGTKFEVPAAEKAAKPASAPPSELPTEHPLLLFPSKPVHDQELVDMTAMVDIVFFLLIFFLVTSMQSIESVLNLPSPQQSTDASATSQPTNYMDDPAFIVVTIDDEDTIWIEEEEIYSEQALRSKLREAIRDDEELTGMLVVGDPDATHGKLVAVLDAGADVGIKELLFSVAEQPEGAGG